MFKSRLQAKFLIWAIVFGIVGIVGGAVVHGLVMRAGVGFPWDYLATLPVLIFIWLVPLWVALNRLVLRHVHCIVEANRRVAAGDESGISLPMESAPADEMGDIMRSREQMLTRMLRAESQLAERAYRLEQLYNAGRELVSLLGSAFGEEELLRRALASLCQFVQAKFGAIGMFNARGELTKFVYYGLTDEEAARIGNPPQGIGLLGAVSREGQVIRLEDLRCDPRHTGFPPHHPQMKTFLGVCIGRGERVYGRLYLTEKEDGQVFTDEDVRVAQSFANSLALALENQWLLEKTQEAEARYRDLYEHAPDGYHFTDADGVIREMNETELEWLGYTREEVVGRLRYDDLVAPEDRAKLPELRSAVAREGEIKEAELHVVRKDGSTFPVRINKTAVYDEKGNYRGSRASVRDITREKELERQFIQAQKMEAIGTLAGGIAHDFNNQLTGIIGFAELALAELEPGSKAHRFVAAIPEQGRQAASLISQLLAFSRQTVLQRQPFDLNLLAKETVQILRHTFPETINIRVIPAPQPAIVEADPSQIQQVLMNLCTNARDAMPAGGDLTIRVTMEEVDNDYVRQHPYMTSGTYVCLSVRDTGTGIPPEHLDRIFEPFFTTKEKGKGTGLGLAMVYGTVKQHGGSINVYSELGKGSEFKVYLPAHTLPTVSTERTAEELPRGKGETVLVVEDQEEVRLVAQAMLESLGYSCITAANGQEALEIYRSRGKEIALVMTDMVMPRMGGRELHAALRELNPEVKVLLMSGYSLDAEVTQLRQEGLAGFVTKPLGLREVAHAVSAALGNSMPTGSNLSQSLQ
jgi:PAS domain S-box-containing protein